MYIGLYVKYPLFLSDFNETLILTRFSKKVTKPKMMFLIFHKFFLKHFSF